MSLWPLERRTSGDTPPGRAWHLPRRAAPTTVFLQQGAAWHYPERDEAPMQLAPGTDWLEALEGQRVRLVISCALTHQCVVSDASLPLPDSDALAQWARHQFVHYHGPLAQAWPIATWLDGSQRGASAVHGVDLDALLRRAKAHRVRLLGMYPWWSVALRRAAREIQLTVDACRCELWIAEGPQVTRLVCIGQRLDAIEQHWLERPATAALATLLGSTVPPQTVPWVMGYGIETDGTAEPFARRLGPMTGLCPAREWVGA